jgi:hypothetical protein
MELEQRVGREEKERRELNLCFVCYEQNCQFLGTLSAAVVYRLYFQFLCKIHADVPMI